MNREAKKGAFSNENALLKLLYLRIKELYNKWNGGHILNWAMVLNQLMINVGLSQYLGHDLREFFSRFQR